MKIITKPIDTAYMRFFVCYCITLQYTWMQNRYLAKRNTVRSIEYVTGRYITEFLKTNAIPSHFNTAIYYELEETGSMIPPHCIWVSKSGSFSAHDLSGMLGHQSYILWDVNRKVALPHIFQDLVGIDEENGILFCRTLGDFHSWQYNSPMRINLDWINIPDFCESLPDDYKLAETKREHFISKRIIDINRNDSDISCFYYLPDFKELLLNNIKLLVQGNLVIDEEENLITMLRTHPDSYEILSDPQLLSEAIYSCTNDSNMHDSIKKKFYPNEDGLPF